MITGIGHAAFIVNDMEKSLEFYCGVLGFTKAFELFRDDGSNYIVYVKICDGQFLELFYPKEEFPPQNMWKSEGYGHLCLTTDDIYKTYDEVKARGAKIELEIQKGKDKNLQFWMQDPDGNGVEIMQIMPESRQVRG